MRSLFSKLLRRAIGNRGYRIVRKSEPLEPMSFDLPTDAIYVHHPVIFEVPVEMCLYPYGLSYGPAGWHPFVETLKAYRRNRDLGYHGSPLEAYYARFQPENMLELFFPREVARLHGQSRIAEYPTSEYTPFVPWDTVVAKARGEKGISAAHGHQSFGPVSDEKGTLEFERLRSTFESIETHGYRPRNTGDGEIRGYFLTDGTRTRFIIRGGQHRTASLAALGFERIRVGFLPNYSRVIHVGSLAQWPLVRAGVYSPRLARRLVDQFLSSEGTWVAEQIGLLQTSDLRAGRR